MIKLIVSFASMALLFTASVAQAQDFQGVAYYVSKTNMSDSFKIDSPGMTEEMKKNLEEGMKKAFENSYTLTFNKTESIYQEEEKLEVPKANNGMMIQVAGTTGGKNYKDIKNRISISEEDFFGKEFLVTDSLAVINWKLEGETKKIGGYTCYKATQLIPVTEKEKQEYADFKKKQSQSATQFLMMDEPKDRTVTVWYTPEIPVSHGPAEYWGLPGLILEASFDKTTILCSKIVVNPKDKVTIKAPKRGKKVTKKEYERQIENQLEQMKDADGNIKIEIHR